MKNFKKILFYLGLFVVVGFVGVVVAQSITVDKDFDLSGTKSLLRVHSIGVETSTPQHAVSIVGSYYSDMVIKGNCTGNVTIDWNNGNTQHCVLTGNVVLTFSNGQSGGNYRLVLKQGGTGSYTVTWPASVRWGGNGQEPNLTNTVGKTDYIGFMYNGIDSKYDGLAFNANF